LYQLETIGYKRLYEPETCCSRGGAPLLSLQNPCRTLTTNPPHDTPTDTPQATKVYLLLSGSHFAVLTPAAAPSGQNTKEAITWGLHVGFLISPFEMLGRPVFELCVRRALTNTRRQRRR
jgi:hypothetical protein